jgi:hypothetical protein
MFDATAFNVSEVFVAEAGVNVGVEEVADGRNTLLPGLKTGADDVKGVGVVVPDSLVLNLIRFGNRSRHQDSLRPFLIFRLGRIIVFF